MFERILVPLDGSELAEQALPLAQELGLKFGAQVTLLRATTSEAEALRETMSDPAAMSMPEVPMNVAKNRVETEAGAAEGYLERMANGMSTSGLKVETRHLEGEPEWAILTVAEDIDASLIVMASHGRGGLGRLVFGSVADKVLRDSSIPVLLVRARD